MSEVETKTEIEEKPNMLTIANPDVLIKDPESMAFYVLKDESLALCKRLDELPYHKNRSTYLSSGRYSPEHRVVVFWPGSINPRRGFDLLVEADLIESDFSLRVSGAVTKVASESKEKTHPGIGRHDRVRQARINDLMKRGLRIQSDQSQERQSDEVQADQG